MITPSEMSQCIPAAEEVLHSINYALKIQRKHLIFFPDPYCVVLLFGGWCFCLVGFFYYYYIYWFKNWGWTLVPELAL